MFQPIPRSRFAQEAADAYGKDKDTENDALWTAFEEDHEKVMLLIDQGRTQEAATVIATVDRAATRPTATPSR